MTTTFTTALQHIQQLVADFAAHQSVYLALDYSEAQARQDFIDKLLMALGWDVAHHRQKNPFEQEVKVERHVTMGHSQRRADYAIYLAPNFRDVRFYVEAKKPSLHLASKDYYFQTIRYGWNSQTPLAILTDFAELHILDCRYKPEIDTILERVVRRFHYRDYANEESFSELYWLFSREAIAANSLEKFVDSLPRKRGKTVQRGLFKGGYQTIDQAFLAELDDHRIVLARSFKQHNPHLDGETLTEMTQRTLDRLVFLRFLEDKLIETRERVADLGNKGSVWSDFVAASRRLDGIYNGVVFKPHAVLDSPQFCVDEAAFSAVCEKLAHVNSPYDFNAISIDILGSIYERFLGNVVSADDQNATVEAKPEVRKAGGVYYTPRYIVDYIVQNTIGQFIAGKTPAQIAELRFADIACGSGSFLLGMYDCLLRYHRDWYHAHPNRIKKSECVLQDDGTLQLSLAKKREILLNNIYGVDIDPQAVEVAQLSLYLKLLEEETTASARHYQLEIHEALLPPLNKNITCGNSLVEMDILDGHLFSPREERKLNPMNFSQRFPEVMQRGGFDAIVGNPPYGAEFSPIETRYLLKCYRLQDYQLDSYLLFIERILKLTKKSGVVGLIIPNTWLVNLMTQKIRHALFETVTIEEIVHYQKPVFSQATVDAQTIIFKTIKPLDLHKIHVVVMSRNNKELSYQVLQERWRNRCGQAINIFELPQASLIADKISKFPLLKDLCAITQGAKPFQVGKGKPPQTREIVDKKPYVSDIKKDNTFKPLLRGSLIQNYLITWNNNYWISLGDWLAEPRYSAQYDAPCKIIIRQTGDSLIAALDNRQFIVRDNLYTLLAKNSDLDLRYFLGIINSSFLNWFYQNIINPERGEALAQVKKGHLVQLPMPPLDLSESLDNNKYQAIIKLVEQMLEAKQRLAVSVTDRDRDYYQNRCATLDQHINALVYQLYSLTAEEIKLVENNAQK